MAKGWHRESRRHSEAALKGKGGRMAPIERSSNKKGAMLNKIVVRRIPDEDPDLSYLENDPRDKERLESYGRSWSMIGIRAEAEIRVPMGINNGILQNITSGGLWGIEDDSDEKYLRSVEDEEIAQLKQILRTMGVKGIDKAPVLR